MYRSSVYLALFITICTPTSTRAFVPGVILGGGIAITIGVTGTFAGYVLLKQLKAISRETL